MDYSGYLNVPFKPVTKGRLVPILNYVKQLEADLAYVRKCLEAERSLFSKLSHVESVTLHSLDTYEDSGRYVTTGFERRRAKRGYELTVIVRI